MSEKAFLRGVVPAVTAPGHGLNERLVPEPVDEGVARVMAALVTVDNRFVVQRETVILHETVNGFQNEVHFEIPAQPVGENLAGECVQNSGEIALPALVVQNK